MKQFFTKFHTKIVIKRDFENILHRPKAWDRQTEAYTYWRECDHCGRNGRLAKPQRSEI